jgi:hypothetical protein
MSTEESLTFLLEHIKKAWPDWRNYKNRLAIKDGGLVSYHFVTADERLKWVTLYGEDPEKYLTIPEVDPSFFDCAVSFEPPMEQWATWLEYDKAYFNQAGGIVFIVNETPFSYALRSADFRIWMDAITSAWSSNGQTNYPWSVVGPKVGNGVDIVYEEPHFFPEGLSANERRDRSFPISLVVSASGKTEVVDLGTDPVGVLEEYIANIDVDQPVARDERSTHQALDTLSAAGSELPSEKKKNFDKQVASLKRMLSMS